MTSNIASNNTNNSYTSKLQKTSTQVAEIKCLPTDICKLISQYAVTPPQEKKRLIIPLYYRAPILRAGLHMPPKSVSTITKTALEQNSQCVIS